jgi:small-conductance mechanosensitive channel
MIQNLIETLQSQTLYGNSLSRWCLAALVAVGTALILWAVRITGRHLEKREINVLLMRTTKIVFVTIARSISFFFILGMALLVGSRFLILPETPALWIRSLFIMLLMLQIGFWLNAYITSVVRRYERRYRESNAGRVTTARSLAFIARIFIFALVFVAALDNVPGVDVTTLVTGLGIGGIAVALAVQNILSDLFASLSITLDKPFVLGDFIIVDDLLGTVEHIGLKTTRIRSLSGEQLIFSNNDLLKSRIHNYKRMAERRVPFTVGVTYQTPPEKLRKVPELFKKLLEQFDDVHFDRAHFKSYGDYSLNFEFVYYVHTSDYNRYMDIQQALNLGLYEGFAAEGIEFAYPTQTLYMDRSGGREKTAEGKQDRLAE